MRTAGRRPRSLNSTAASLRGDDLDLSPSSAPASLHVGIFKRRVLNAARARGSPFEVFARQRD
jgi:hypothetical protein